MASKRALGVLSHHEGLEAAGLIPRGPYFACWVSEAGVMMQSSDDWGRGLRQKEAERGRVSQRAFNSSALGGRVARHEGGKDFREKDGIRKTSEYPLMIQLQSR